MTIKRLFHVLVLGGTSLGALNCGGMDAGGNSGTNQNVGQLLPDGGTIPNPMPGGGNSGGGGGGGGGPMGW
jgi:hypothetical protein